MHKLTLKLDVQTGRPKMHHSHRNWRWKTTSDVRNPRNSGRNRAPRVDSLRQVVEGSEARRLVAEAQRGDDGDGRPTTWNSRWFSHREEKKRREMGVAARDGKEEGALGFQVALRERGGAGEGGRGGWRWRTTGLTRPSCSLSGEDDNAKKNKARRGTGLVVGWVGRGELGRGREEKWAAGKR
jgi:hypothetical protein